MQTQIETRLAETARAEPDFLSESELLRRLPVSRRTLTNWRKSGRLPFVKLPGSRRVLCHWPSIAESLLRSQQSIRQ
jgi:predicted site-specific integrase-resolvase